MTDMKQSSNCKVQSGRQDRRINPLVTECRKTRLGLTACRKEQVIVTGDEEKVLCSITNNPSSLAANSATKHPPNIVNAHELLALESYPCGLADSIDGCKDVIDGSMARGVSREAKVNCSEAGSLCEVESRSGSERHVCPCTGIPNLRTVVHPEGGSSSVIFQPGEAEGLAPVKGPHLIHGTNNEHCIPVTGKYINPLLDMRLDPDKQTGYSEALSGTLEANDQACIDEKTRPVTSTRINVNRQRLKACQWNRSQSPKNSRDQGNNHNSTGKHIPTAINSLAQGQPALRLKRHLIARQLTQHGTHSDQRGCSPHTPNSANTGLLAEHRSTRIFTPRSVGKYKRGHLQLGWPVRHCRDDASLESVKLQPTLTHQRIITKGRQKTASKMLGFDDSENFLREHGDYLTTHYYDTPLSPCESLSLSGSVSSMESLAVSLDISDSEDDHESHSAPCSPVRNTQDVTLPKHVSLPNLQIAVNCEQPSRPDFLYLGDRLSRSTESGDSVAESSFITPTSEQRNIGTESRPRATDKPWHSKAKQGRQVVKSSQAANHRAPELLLSVGNHFTKDTSIRETARHRNDIFVNNEIVPKKSGGVANNPTKLCCPEKPKKQRQGSKGKIMTISGGVGANEEDDCSLLLSQCHTCGQVLQDLRTTDYGALDETTQPRPAGLVDDVPQDSHRLGVLAPPLNDNIQYHAYFLFHQHNRDWVLGLIDKLESPRLGFRCCCQERDFPSSLTLPQSVLYGMKNALKTVIVMSTTLVAASWAQIEAIVAGAADTSSLQRDVVILMVEQCEIPPSLSELPYLDIHNGSIWWTKLLARLALPDELTITDEALLAISPSLIGIHPELHSTLLLLSIKSKCTCCGKEVIDTTEVPDELIRNGIQISDEEYSEVMCQLMHDLKFRCHIWCYNMPLAIAFFTLLLVFCLVLIPIIESRYFFNGPETGLEFVHGGVVWLCVLTIYMIITHLSRRKLHFFYYEIEPCLGYMMELLMGLEECNQCYQNNMASSDITVEMECDDIISHSLSDRITVLENANITNASIQIRAEEVLLDNSGEYISLLITKKLDRPSKQRHVKGCYCLCQFVEQRLYKCSV